MTSGSRWVKVLVVLVINVHLNETQPQRNETLLEQTCLKEDRGSWNFAAAVSSWTDMSADIHNFSECERLGDSKNRTGVQDEVGQQYDEIDEDRLALVDTGLVSRKTSESASFVLNIFVIPVVAVLGFVGNTLSIITLLKKSPPRDAITWYLIGLSLTDLLLMLCFMLSSIVTIDRQFNDYLATKLSFFIFISINVFLALIFKTMSAFITIILSVERAVAVKFPFHVKNIFVNRHPRKVLVALYCFVICFYLPNLFRFRQVVVEDPVLNETKVLFMPTEFSRKTSFFVYYGTIGQVIARIMPTVLVLICNMVTIITVRASNRYRKQMVSHDVQEIKTTRLLLTISLIFLITSMLNTTNGLLVKFVPTYGLYKRDQYLYSLISVLGFLSDALNSAVNFIIYMFLASGFRKTFFSIWSCDRKRTGGSTFGKSGESMPSTSKTDQTASK